MFSIFKKKPKDDGQLFYKTEIHCHLAPGIDDGQRYVESAVDLVDQERRWGIETLYCTPHMTQDTFENTLETISEAFGKLKNAVDEKNIDIKLDYSAEHRLDTYFLGQLEEGNIRPFPNKFILVENSYMLEAWNLDQMLFDLKVKGYQPILAHPERYSYYHDKKQRYEQLHNSGLYFQVNLLSLAGYYGKDVKQVAEYLIKNDMVDFLGSDMHNHSHSRAINEYLHTKDYRKHADTLRNRILNDTAFLPSTK